MFESLLDVEQLDELVFQNVSHRENFRRTLYGGQVLAQALMAAIKTVEHRAPHSLHAYFLRAGSSNHPIRFEVEKIRDGGSISSRRVVASQQNNAIFHLSASFHQKEDGFQHSDSMPSHIPQPEELDDNHDSASTLPEHGDTNSEASPFKIIALPENIFTSKERHKPEACFWIKTIKRIPDTLAFHAAALAFASDLGLLATTLLPHPTTLFSEDIFAASIDHAMWFHVDDFKTTEWMLFTIKSPWAGNARGLAHASIYEQSGRMIASTSQEGLIRPTK